MAESNVDLFDPHTMMEGFLLAKNHGLSSESDFAFAFNDSNFSDRLLRIEVMPDFPDSKSDAEGCVGGSIGNWARNRKRRRQDIRKDAGKPALYICRCQLPRQSFIKIEPLKKFLTKKYDYTGIFI